MHVRCQHRHPFHVIPGPTQPGALPPPLLRQLVIVTPLRHVHPQGGRETLQRPQVPRLQVNGTIQICRCRPLMPLMTLFRSRLRSEVHEDSGARSSVPLRCPVHVLELRLRCRSAAREASGERSAASATRSARGKGASSALTGGTDPEARRGEARSLAAPDVAAAANTARF